MLSLFIKNLSLFRGSQIKDSTSYDRFPTRNLWSTLQFYAWETSVRLLQQRVERVIRLVGPESPWVVDVTVLILWAVYSEKQNYKKEYIIRKKNIITVDPPHSFVYTWTQKELWEKGLWRTNLRGQVVYGCTFLTTSFKTETFYKTSLPRR